jgi:hypothetical protein
LFLGYCCFAASLYAEGKIYTKFFHLFTFSRLVLGNNLGSQRLVKTKIAYKVGGSQQNFEGSECLWKQLHFYVLYFIFGNDFMSFRKISSRLYNNYFGKKSPLILAEIHSLILKMGNNGYGIIL